MRLDCACLLLVNIEPSPPLRKTTKPFSVGINCALGGKDMRPYVEELAQVALFLASDEARFITGTEIVVDGGMTM